MMNTAINQGSMANFQLTTLAQLPVVNADDMNQGQRLAALEAWLGLTREFANDRKRFLAAARDSTDTGMLERAAKAWSLLPSPDRAELEASLALARKAVQLDHGRQSPLLFWDLMALGMAEYRHGDFADADKTLAEAINSSGGNPWVVGISSFYRAMSLFRLNRIDEAKTLVSQTTASMKPLLADPLNPFRDGVTHDDVILWLAYKEAKDMMPSENEPASAPKEASKPGSAKP